MSADGGRATPLFRLYCAVTALLSPLASRIALGKLEKAGIPPDRRRERLGHATLPRPDGRLVWFHAASVGESLSVLTLIARLGERLGDAGFLITSGTPASAELVARRLPPSTRHQFAPLDLGGPVNRFLDHWRPDAGIFVESEIWPRTLIASHRRGVRLALLNARLSDRSVAGWRKWPDTARYVLGSFDVFVTQNRQAADNLVAMGADPSRVRPGTNLKATSAPLPVDRPVLDQTRAALGGRPVWIASSTHSGEEETVLEAHRLLLKRHLDLCLVLIPRHPDRGDNVAALVERAGLTGARRSVGQAITADTQVYLADTLGETGTWYALSPLVFLGGSLTDIGGHNPFEPAQAGAAILTGPGHHNFAETFAPLIAAGGAVQVTGADDLAAVLAQWLEGGETLQRARDAAASCVASRQAELDGVIELLCERLALEG